MHALLSDVVNPTTAILTYAPILNAAQKCFSWEFLTTRLASRAQAIKHCLCHNTSPLNT